jgi:signal transduction histidine kinase
MNVIRLVYTSLLLLTVNTGRAQLQEIDSAKSVFEKIANDDSASIKTCFFIADAYMNIEKYDSAQIWLNRIHEKVPLKRPSLFNYFLITRQAEVFYYNNLQQLGLQESFKGLDVAQALNDPLLLADSYNFLGLFYMNIDSSKEAIPFYKKGLLFGRQPPYPPQYLSLSKPHHLYSNMAMAFYRLGMYDSALVNIRLSLKKAYEINWERGIAVGHKGAGDVFLATHAIDSALVHYQKGKATARKSLDIDVELVCFGGYAKALDETEDYTGCKKQLDSGMQILKNKPTLNRYFAFQFLTIATGVYKKRLENERLAQVLELKSEMEMANLKSGNQQIQTILKAGVENEKRLLAMEVTEAQHKRDIANNQLLVVLAAFALLAVAFLWYRNAQKQKIQFANVRHKISQDLHDDIGASLSSLQIYGSIAEQSIAHNPAKAMEMVKKISGQSTLLLENMSDIVWSMKPATDHAASLEIKVKNFGAELLSDKNIHFTYQLSNEVETALTGIYARKNILLVIKEAMNNIAKYSQAQHASVSISIQEKRLLLTVGDDGVGFYTAKKTTGNGLQNMNERVKELGGTFNIISSPGKGCGITCEIPLEGLNKKG